MVDEKPARLLQIADPCPAAWEAMSGPDAQRHCAQCGKTVHHLSAMAPADAEKLLVEGAPSGICVRVRCDSEGFVVHDAPSEPRTARRRLQLLAPAVLAALAACNTVAEGDDLVVEGPSLPLVASNAPQDAISARAPTRPADAVESVPRVTPEQGSDSFLLEAQLKPPSPSFFRMGVTAVVDPPSRPGKRVPSHQASADQRRQRNPGCSGAQFALAEQPSYEA